MRSEPVSVAQVITAIQCELASIYSGGAGEASVLMSWVARTKLQLNIDESTNIAPGLTLTPKLASATMTLPGSGGFSDVVSRDATLDFNTALWDLDPETEAGADLAARCPEPGSAIASTGLGLADWLTNISSAISASSPAAAVTNVSYVASFTVTRSVTGGITFKTAMIDAKINPSTASRTRANILTITFARDPSRGAGDADALLAPDLLNEQLDRQMEELTKEPGITLVPGDVLVVQ